MCNGIGVKFQERCELMQTTKPTGRHLRIQCRTAMVIYEFVLLTWNCPLQRKEANQAVRTVQQVGLAGPLADAGLAKPAECPPQLLRVLRVATL